jgi:flagellar motor switch/type III secretory pathway protein FliN
MADGGQDDVLGQKALAAQRAFEARGMSPTKALRRAASRTADYLWDLALVTQNVQIETLDQDGVIESLDKKDLLLLLDGPDGAIGLAAVDRSVLTGIVEVQTIQQVTQLPVDEERELTPTDAAMMSPLLDGTLSRLEDALDGSPTQALVAGFRFGAMIEDPRAASLLLDAASYRAFRADMDLALGRRKGRLSLILPEPRVKRGGDTDADKPGPHAELLGRVPARLDAVLTRITLPLSRARVLKVGDTLTLSRDALDRVEVYAGPGHLVAKGRLGQLNGNRAVRLTWPVIGPAGMAVGEAASGPEFSMESGSSKASGFGNDFGGSDLPALPDIDFNAAEDDGEEVLPDLPPLDFASEAAEFNMDDIDFSGGSEEDGGFASAPMDFDFNN